MEIVICGCSQETSASCYLPRRSELMVIDFYLGAVECVSNDGMCHDSPYIYIYAIFSFALSFKPSRFSVLQDFTLFYE